MAFSPDNTVFATGTGNAEIKLWDMTTRKYIGDLSGCRNEVYSLAFSPDGTRLASAGDDGLVMLWDVSEAIRNPDPVVTAHFTGPPMYWIDKAKGTPHSLVGQEVASLVPSVDTARSLAVDTIDEKLYWIEKTGKRTGKIRRANLDGRNVELVKDLTSVPLDIALDTVDRKIYLTNAWGKVQPSQLQRLKLPTQSRYRFADLRISTLKSIWM